MARTVKRQTESRSENRPVALLFGLGYSAKALLPQLQSAGYDIIATVRSQEKADRLSNKTGVKVIAFTGHVDRDLKKTITSANIILSSVPPADDGTDQVISAIPNIAKLAANCEWTGYLSATSVYGDRQGKWAFEDELLYPATKRGKNRIMAELAWLESGLPVHVFRLSGIYGPNILGQARNAFSRIRSGQVRSVIKPGHIVNRIHVNDIASAVMASIDKPDAGQVYNISDGNPAPPQDVLDFAADLIGEPRPPHIDFTEAELTPMARSFYLETKRIDNSRAKKDLDWKPQHTSYRDGLCDIYRKANFGPEAFLLAGHVIVSDADLEAVRRELPGHKKATIGEPGCLRFNVFQDLKDKYKFHVFEAFKSEADFRTHKKRMQGTDWVKASANVERFYTVSKA